MAPPVANMRHWVRIVSPKSHRSVDLHLRDNNRNGARTVPLQSDLSDDQVTIRERDTPPNQRSGR